MPIFGRKVPHLRCDSDTSFKLKGQRSGSPGPLILTHIVRHIFRMARPTIFELGLRMEDDDLHQPQVKGQRHKLTSSVLLISASSYFLKQNDVPVSLEAGGGIPCRPNPVATLLVLLDITCRVKKHCATIRLADVATEYCTSQST